MSTFITCVFGLIFIVVNYPVYATVTIDDCSVLEDDTSVINSIDQYVFLICPDEMSDVTKRELLQDCLTEVLRKCEVNQTLIPVCGRNTINPDIRDIKCVNMSTVVMPPPPVITEKRVTATNIALFVKMDDNSQHAQDIYIKVCHKKEKANAENCTRKDAGNTDDPEKGTPFLLEGLDSNSTIIVRVETRNNLAYKREIEFDIKTEDKDGSGNAPAELPTSTVVGIVLGVLGVIVIAIGIAFYWIKKRNEDTKDKSSPSLDPANNEP